MSHRTASDYRRSAATKLATAGLISAGLLLGSCAQSDADSDRAVSPAAATTLGATSTEASNETSNGMPTGTSIETSRATSGVTQSTDSAPEPTSPTPTAGVAPGVESSGVPESAWMLKDDNLVEFDPQTKQPLQLFEYFTGDGVARTHLLPTTRSIYYWQSADESWRACDTALGTIGRFDVVTHENSVVDLGRDPAISADGTMLAYLAASRCFSDPDEPAAFLSVADLVRVSNLQTGKAITVRVASSGGATVGGVAIYPNGDLAIAMTSGDVYRLPPVDGATIENGVIVASLEAQVGDDATIPKLVGVAEELLIFASTQPGASDSMLFAIDPSSPSATREIVHIDGELRASVDGNGNVLIVGSLDDAIEIADPRVDGIGDVVVAQFDTAPAAVGW